MIKETSTETLDIVIGILIFAIIPFLIFLYFKNKKKNKPTSPPNPSQEKIENPYGMDNYSAMVFELLDETKNKEEVKAIFKEWNDPDIDFHYMVNSRIDAWKNNQVWWSKEDYKKRMDQGRDVYISKLEYEAEKAAKFFLKKNTLEERFEGVKKRFEELKPKETDEVYKLLSFHIFSELERYYPEKEQILSKARKEFLKDRDKITKKNINDYLAELNDKVKELLKSVKK